MRFWHNAFIYAVLMIMTLLGAFTIDGWYMLGLGEIEWALVSTVLTALGFGFKSAVEANVELMKMEGGNVPTLTDRNSGTTE